jgi:hypothetical protein
MYLRPCVKLDGGRVILVRHSPPPPHFKIPWKKTKHLEKINFETSRGLFLLLRMYLKPVSQSSANLGYVPE